MPAPDDADAAAPPDEGVDPSPPSGPRRETSALLMRGIERCAASAAAVALATAAADAKAVKSAGGRNGLVGAAIVAESDSDSDGSAATRCATVTGVFGDSED